MTRILALACAVLSVVAGRFGQADAAEPAPGTGQWKFTAAIYGWIAGIDGTVAAFGTPAADADASLGGVLDRLEAGYMGLGEARHGRFCLAGDVYWVRLSEEQGIAIGPIASSAEVTTESSMWTGVAGYALVHDDAASLDAIAGARVWSVNNLLRIGSGPLEGMSTRDDATWVDPVVGVKGMAQLGSRYYATGWALVGGFGAGSDSMWDVTGVIGYRFSDTFSVAAGYRILGVDYRDDGFAYDIEQSGPMLGAAVEF